MAVAVLCAAGGPLRAPLRPGQLGLGGAVGRGRAAAVTRARAQQPGLRGGGQRENRQQNLQ